MNEDFSSGPDYYFEVRNTGSYITGWTCNGNACSYNDYIPLEIDMVISAVWEEGHTVTLDPGDGIGEVVTLTVPFNGAFYMNGNRCASFCLDENRSEVQDCYTGFSYEAEGMFVSCYTDGVNTYLAGQDYYPEGDLYLTAVWEKGIAVSLDPGEGENLDAEEPSEKKMFYCPVGGTLHVGSSFIDVGKPLQSNESFGFNFAKEGSAFVGWTDERSITYRVDSQINPTEDTTLTALYIEPTVIRLESGLSDGKYAEINVIDGGALVFTPQNTVKTFTKYQPNDPDSNWQWWQWTDCYGYTFLEKVTEKRYHLRCPQRVTEFILTSLTNMFFRLASPAMVIGCLMEILITSVSLMKIMCLWELALMESFMAGMT